MKSKLPHTLIPFIWHFTKPYRWQMLVCFIVPILMCLETTLVPYCLGVIIDLIAQYDEKRSDIFSDLVHPLVLLGGTHALFIVVFRGQDLLQARLWPRYAADLRLGMFRSLSQFPQHFFADRFSGNLANKVSDVVNALTSLFYTLRWSFISTIAASIGALIIIGLILPSFAILLAAWITAHTLIGLYFSRKAKQFSQNNAEHKSELSGQIVDVFSNINNVLLFSARNREIRNLEAHQANETRSHQSLLTTMSLARCAMEVPAAIMLIGLFSLLIRGWLNHDITGGQFALIFLSTRHVFFNVWMMSMQLPEVFRDFGIARQAISILSAPNTLTDLPNARALHATQGHVSFKAVDFYYQKHKPVFRKLNFDIPNGQKVGIVGVSGSGKTTLVNLLLRMHDVIDGSICIDGQNIATVTQDSLRDAVAMIPQDTSLFHRTLMENIRYGKPDASDEDVIIAAKRAHCHDFIMQTSEGYETLVGERGVKLSGGQRQRIAIARAMLKDAPLLILDEATSALDSVTERLIQKSLETLMHSRTSIIIAHRLSTLRNMDRIIVFDNGQIIEDDPHDALLSQRGHYANLWRMQVNGFLPDNLDEKPLATNTLELPETILP